MRVLVTGVEGFVGRHLVAHLGAVGSDVIGAVRSVDTVSAELRIPLHALDITDRDAVRGLVADVRPTHIVHLAAVSSVRWSLEHSEETQRVNVGGTRHVLDAAAALPAPPRTLIIGSGEEYGPNDGQPLPELPLAALRPASPYAESKVAAERLIEETPAYQAFALRTRSFPHFGPGQRTGFVTADVASQLVEIERGRRGPVLRVGDTDVVRDYTDVRDVVRAYVLLLDQGVPGEVYNVCSGRGRRIRELLDSLVAHSGLSVRIEQEKSRIRPSEIHVLVGDNTKLRAATGWSPVITIEQTLREILDWWRDQK